MSQEAPPPPIKSDSTDSADGSKAQRKRPWSKPTVRLHNGVIDAESGLPLQFNDVNGQAAGYCPES